ncbi:MAG: YggS family pyridoxal phosphate-dependent enzyme [Oxalobacter sp.]|nr:YggS family pyridoxal phosphate-dependent enzyme [Oxalobacter sp.]
MASIKESLKAVKQQLASAAQQCARNPEDVKLLAVSKTKPVDAILEAVDAGQMAFGENYEQEGVAKIQAIKELRPDLKLEWHFIGPVQGNKTRAIATNFDWVHAVDRERIAKRLSDQRPAGMPPINICIQVNISGEASKSGVTPQEVLPLAKAISAYPNLRLRGLMAIPEPVDDPAKQHEPFKAMKALLGQLQENGFDVDTLSMGMSADMVPAIEEGATVVRIGTAIFGARSYSAG